MGHFDCGFGAAEAEFAGGSLIDVGLPGGLLVLRCRLDGAGIFEQFELVAGFVEGVKAGRAEEDDGVAGCARGGSGREAQNIRTGCE